MNKLIRAVLGLSMIMTASAMAPAVAYAADKQAVVLQVSDNNPATWTLTLNIAKNLQADLGKDKVNVEIVTFGPGINMLKFDSEVGNRLEQAKKEGVAIQACQNTMRSQKLVEKDMHPSATFVPAGVVQIMKRQKEGWSYIRP